jgi:hypothetical protein
MAKYISKVQRKIYYWFIRMNYNKKASIFEAFLLW